MMIHSILDNDLYKFTTSYAYMKKFPHANRFNMCAKSFLPIGLSVKVSSIEESLSINYPDGVPSYKTIEYFQMKFPKDELYIIVTAETLSEIPNWKFGDKILKENKFIITSGGQRCLY